MNERISSRPKANARSVKDRQCWEVTGGGKLYRTIDAAAKKEAWHMIMTRYIGPGELLSNIKTVRGMECDCYEEDVYGGGGSIVSVDCPIHSRHDGYFYRLHRRLWPQIKTDWERRGAKRPQE